MHVAAEADWPGIGTLMKSSYLAALLVLSLVGCSSSDRTLGPELSAADTQELDEALCPPGTEFDALEDACFIICDGLSDEQCYALEEAVFGDLDELVVDNYAGIDSLANTNIKARYSVQADLSLVAQEITEPESDARFRQIWSSATRILPSANVRQTISQFHIDSDGQEGSLAYVTNDLNRDGQWILAFDDADYLGPDDREFIHTTIHEFGHLVFLADDQLDAYATGSCATFGLDEGCSYRNSYINQFYQRFWADIIDEHDAIVSELDASAFYSRYFDRFVSEYASTNPIEDAAETFTNFVLRERPDSANSVVNQKILLMHEMQALVQLRSDIRAKLMMTRARMRQSKQ